MYHMAAKPPEEWEEVDAEIRAIAEECKRRVAHLPRGQKGAAYRACIKELLGKL